MSKIIRNLAFALTLATPLTIALALTSPSFADDDTIIAKINGHDVTEAELNLAIEDLDAQFSQLPADKRRAAALSALFEIKLIAQAASNADLDKTDEFKQRVEFMRERALHSLYINSKVADALSDEEIRAQYDKQLSETKPESEIKASHILLKTKEEAEQVIKDLDGGADFAAVAKEKSTGPSGPQGGDLGYFRPGQMVPEFEKAAFGLEIGAHSKEPVKTQFGWHVLKVGDRRAIQPPAFDAVKEQLRSTLMRDKYFELVRSMRKGAEIEVLDEQLKPVMDKLENAN